MGEYAKYNGQSVKIGTCESMYYLRYSQRHDVQAEAHSLDPATTTGLFWRLPFPDEDAVPPGSFKEHNRGFRLYRNGTGTASNPVEDFNPEGLEPGTIQLSHPSGLMVNVPCHHGAKLPEVGGANSFWNGRTWHLELASIKNLPDGTFRPVVHCRFCGQMWSFDWSDVKDYIAPEMWSRLEQYAENPAAA